MYYKPSIQKNTKFTNNLNLSDVNYWKSVGTKKKHKRAYPLEMVSDILKCFPQNLKVLDIYLGSGTTAIACHNLNFDFTGYEIDKEYFEAAKKRIEQHKQQGRLW
mgnify:FL=1